MRPPHRFLALLVLALALDAVLASDSRAQLTLTSAPVAGSTVIDFNSLTDNAVITDQFAAQGVTISGGACANSYYSTILYRGDPMQVTNFTGSGTFCDGSTGYLPLTFNFASPITSFGFNVLANSDQLVFATAAGVLSTRLSRTLPLAFVGFASDTPVGSVTVTAPGNGAFVFDNLAFAVTTTPEPASLALLASGLIGVFGIARRKVQGTDAA